MISNVHHARSKLRELSFHVDLGGDDCRTVHRLITRASELLTELERLVRQVAADKAAFRTQTAGAGFWAYPTIGKVPFETGQMARGPRTSNRHRPARSA
ncbi:hypothetical protein [Actinomycetospora atypica]|uniref:Uncharacterized protein n=1 Tax=Actinomycetospora atypica TaxID=1290095 RepID=A0ABV9YNV2_9PSEU